MKKLAFLLLFILAPLGLRANVTGVTCDILQLNPAQTAIVLAVCEVRSDDADNFVTEITNSDTSMILGAGGNIRAADRPAFIALLKARYQAAIPAMRIAFTANQTLQAKKLGAKPVFVSTEVQ